MEKENEKANKKLKIYVADTDEKKTLANYFDASEKFELIGSSTNGHEVIEDCKNLKPDFLISEVLLSECDGFLVLESLKQSMQGECPKIIFISNLSHSGFVSKAIKEGASYFMVKPVSPQNLEIRIDELSKQTIQPDEREKDLKQKQNEKQLDEKISNIFISIGIPAHIKGYQFLREAVKLAVEEPEIIGSITKRLYPAIAEKFETSSSKVERGMRHAIEVAWNRGKIENINTLFGLRIYSSNEKPTNGELIALIADKMLMEG